MVDLIWRAKFWKMSTFLGKNWYIVIQFPNSREKKQKIIFGNRLLPCGENRTKFDIIMKDTKYKYYIQRMRFYTEFHESHFWWSYWIYNSKFPKLDHGKFVISDPKNSSIPIFSPKIGILKKFYTLRWTAILNFSNLTANS